MSQTVTAAPALAAADTAAVSLSSGAGTGARFTRKLRIARWFLVGSMALLALFVPVQTLMELVVFAIVQGENADRVGLWPSAVALAFALPCGAAGFWMIRARVDGRRVASPWLYWGSLVMLVLVCAFIQLTPNVCFVYASWWGVVAFVAPRRRTLYVSIALLVLPWAHLFLTPLGVPLPVMVFVWLFAIAWMLVVSGGCLALIHLWDITTEALEGQVARARLAVSQERLRLAHDVQDLAGLDLAVIEAGARRAERLVERDPRRARDEIDEVHELARRVLQQVRSAVSGYRGVDLAAEAESVAAVLRANGTHTTVIGTEHTDRFPQVAGLAAWVVREGATNVLRHSDARRCQISFSVEEDAENGHETLVVRVRNDRARGGPRDGAASASGLAGLSQRISRQGGTLSASRTPDGGFLLRVVLPPSEGPRHIEESR